MSIAFAVIFYGVFVAWSDFSALGNALVSFKWNYLWAILALSLANFLIRFIKWQYYLNILSLKIPRLDSLEIFLAGLSLSITPGKLGEVFRSYLLKIKYQIPLSKTGTIVIADRLSDLIAMVVLSTIGAIGYQYGQKIIWLTAGAILILVVMVVVRPIGDKIVKLLNHFSFFKRRAKAINSLYESSYQMLLPRRLLLTSALAVLGWGMEALGFWLTFRAIGTNLSLLAAMFIYSFSTIVGAISALPGGLGVTESSMAGLLVLANINKAVAFAATLVIRAATLWFAVALGGVALLIFQKRNKL